MNNKTVEKLIKEGDLKKLNKYLTSNGVSEKVARDYINSLYIDNLGHRFNGDSNITKDDTNPHDEQSNSNKKSVTNVFLFTFLLISTVLHFTNNLNLHLTLFVYVSVGFIVLVKFKLHKFLK